MYASVTSGTIQPGKLDEFLTVYRESAIAFIKEFSGIKHFFVLTDAETNKGMSIAIYETEADAERTQTSGDFQKAVGLLASTLVAESITREGYEVSIQF
jgi:heme-degrading monooxygenase HmoA